ncbi:hypothetical protein HanRHA438_Chr10g0454531 [Helianthus annuus]|nr:hypothetical protein HanRHA438_Chr10g0454531 [Helianthus annuus]
MKTTVRCSSPVVREGVNGGWGLLVVLGVWLRFCSGQHNGLASQSRSAVVNGLTRCVTARVSVRSTTLTDGFGSIWVRWVRVSGQVNGSGRIGQPESTRSNTGQQSGSTGQSGQTQSTVRFGVRHEEWLHFKAKAQLE